MRILLSSITYPPHLNGQSIFTRNLAEGLATYGHEVIVLIAGGTETPRLEWRNGVKLVKVPTVHLSWIHPDLWMPLVLNLSIRQIFRQFQPQLVHVQDPSPLGQAVTREARRQNTPALITYHSGPAVTAPYLRINNPILKKSTDWAAWQVVIAFLNQASLVTVPSKYSATMLKNHGLQADIQIIPCGVQLNDFRPDSNIDRKAVRQRYGLDPDKTLFLYVGRIDVEKNLDVVLQAMVKVKYPDIQLAIAGRGPKETCLQQLAESLGLQKQVRFLGQIDQSCVPELLNMADIFVIPGNSESFSIATLEAMSCAKPVLAVDASALPELITAGVNGYLFQPNLPEDAARGMEYLATNQEQRAAMGLFSMLKAKDYSIFNMLQAYQQVYRLCVQKSSVSTSPESRATNMPLWSLFKWNPRFLYSPRLLGAVAMILSMLFSILFYDQVQAISNLRLTDMATWNVETVQKLLVVAPHPDDEVLAAGGLIQRVLATGGQVEVMVVSNGDGQYMAPLFVDYRMLQQAEYIKIGQRRQQETLSALKKLGVNEDKVSFLGYPDGKLDALWGENWLSIDPVIAPYTRATRSPYENTYNPNAYYLGSNLYHDLLVVIEKFQPDIVVIPHPEDTNLDHRAVSNFTQFVVAASLSSGNYKSPAILGYLVHYQSYPIPRGINMNKVLLPPAPLANKGEGWVTYSLSSQERQNKLDAIRTYASQQKMMGNSLRSFARANEIFFELPIVELPVMSFEGNEVLEDELQAGTTLSEPSREQFTRLVLSDADLVAWNVVRLGNVVCFGAETRGPTSNNLDYRILLKLPDGEPLHFSSYDNFVWVTDHRFGTCMTFAALGNPSVVGFSAETRYHILLDQTAWHFVRFSDHK